MRFSTDAIGCFRLSRVSKSGQVPHGISHGRAEVRVFTVTLTAADPQPPETVLSRAAGSVQVGLHGKSCDAAHGRGHRQRYGCPTSETRFVQRQTGAHG